MIRAMADHLQLRARLGRALDIGCGAGVSTAALAPLAETLIGVEPEPVMLAHRRAVAPNACFIAAQAESLPFLPGTIDLVAAAGSLNYAAIDLFLPEAARVLTPNGVLIIY